MNSQRNISGFLGVCVAVGLAASAATASSIPRVIAGGTLDSNITNADVYVGTPQSGKVRASKACRLVERYVDYVNTGRYGEVADLFEDDALLMEPTGNSQRGHSEINGFYTGLIKSLRPTVVAVAYVGDDKDCMVELTNLGEVNGMKAYTLVSVDHFTLGASGKFSRMVAFNRAMRR